MLFLTGPVTPHVRDLVRLEIPSCSASFRLAVQVLLLDGNGTGALDLGLSKSFEQYAHRLHQREQA